MWLKLVEKIKKYVHFPQFNWRVSFKKLLRMCYIKISPIYYVFFHPQFRSVIRNIENHCAILTLIAYYYRLINYVTLPDLLFACVSRREQMAHFELNLEQYEKYIFPPAAFFFCWYMAFGKLDKKCRPTYRPAALQAKEH